MIGCMDGWMIGSIDGWMLGWKDGWMDGRNNKTRLVVLNSAANLYLLRIIF